MTSGISATKGSFQSQAANRTSMDQGQGGIQEKLKKLFEDLMQKCPELAQALGLGKGAQAAGPAQAAQPGGGSQGGGGQAPQQAAPSSGSSGPSGSGGPEQAGAAPPGGPEQAGADAGGIQKIVEELVKAAKEDPKGFANFLRQNPQFKAVAQKLLGGGEGGDTGAEATASAA